MTRKAKPKKHTVKEIQAKVDAATTNKGGRKVVIVDRTGQGKGGHTKFEYPHCKVTASNVKSIEIHHDARHPKNPFNETKISNLHAMAPAAVAKSSSKPRPGVRGSLKK